MTLRPAATGDLPYIRSLAGDPQNARYLTDEDDDALSGYLADPTARLLIWGADAPRGFALYCDVGRAGRVVELRRLCLQHPGQGEGAALLQNLIDLAFVAFGASRLWLDCNSENLRAQRTYLREGFTQEGRLRAQDYFALTDQYDDVLLYGMLRHEWQRLARRSGLADPPPDA